MTATGRDAATSLENVPAPGSMLTVAAARSLAVLRIALGFVFLWAFLDKTFGWGYATPSERAWLNGGSPTKGFLSGVDVGPFQSFFTSIAGAAWADWLFMIGLLGIGLALILGIGMRIAAGAGALMMLLMWFAEFPPAKTTGAGEATHSTNPFVDYHLIYGLGVIVTALTYAGHTWGLGRWWASLPLVRHNRWLI
ncbi:thiosulfate dehydrogenase [quinone] large subunit [Actinoplanes octamycinicus]|uniref:Thiosulfate dehydrogenase [quinone] large subunit n=1 Tax=Actinoplanes octamycinicus TaxID=135948 RepID=A0A7W7H2S7_9ACTN|nr:DoxX family membrane protein [Actinoplanes octamycinicus]MBB4742933.1 thiosulfate dehydrogenase [quinone] large subunit [Actinoplanes octamycinicus]GIE58215.1 membrane protein [Actinoplanes octamycinicus]